MLSPWATHTTMPLLLYLDHPMILDIWPLWVSNMQSSYPPPHRLPSLQLHGSTIRIGQAIAHHHRSLPLMAKLPSTSCSLPLQLPYP